MAAAAALAALWPVLRKPTAPAEPDAAASEAAFYRAQLEEIKRDVERGQLPQSEAEAARAEAARRLIALNRAGPEAPKEPPRARHRLAAAALIAVGLPAVAIPLYGLLGRPLMPDEPLASRHEMDAAAKNIEAAVAGVEAHLVAKPDDGRGWAVIAPVYMRLERYQDAAHAYSEALRLLGEDPSRRAAYGEALFVAAGGIVTEKARQAFDTALAEEPGQPQARFYLALGAEQDGKKEEAIQAYQALLKDATPDAAWVGAVKSRLAMLEGEAAPAVADASPAIPAAQRPMIEGMVSRLANRLASGGGSVDEWARLIRAYAVLHEADKAKAALADARKALAPDANAVASLDALARDLGLGEAN
ncbi:MAG: c-type cytochrome biogenesis protein CcmI [Caulobacteraceae bacterium]|nr:c-type cytochrome biogenesis protein CcmI [Caulobacteraceae bacterium]